MNHSKEVSKADQSNPIDEYFQCLSYCDIHPKGTLICGLCGEDLVKKPFIRLNQIIALVAASLLLLSLIHI